MKDKARLEAESLKGDYLGASRSFTRAVSSHIITTKLLELEMAVKLEAAKSDLSQSVKNTLRIKLTGESENPAGGFTTSSANDDL